MRPKLAFLVTEIFLATLIACANQSSTSQNPIVSTNEPPTTESKPSITLSPTITPEPPRVLNVCQQEPTSLFLYSDTTSAARNVHQAIYDGPFDIVGYELQSVILEKIPSLEDESVYLRPVTVVPGDLIVDANGNWVSLQAGVNYRPSGCTEPSCGEIFDEQDSVQIDELVVNFKLLPGILWADGEKLTASDSVYSFKVFQHLFKNTASETLRYTQSYEAMDELTIEWVGIPGYQGSFSTRFFTPLPEHLWGGFTLDELLTNEISTKTPLGWGPYLIEEWVLGDHITLSRNPYYFKSEYGLPHFDYLVFRFIKDGDEAIDALIAGECDLVDQTVLHEAHIPRLQENQKLGRLSFVIQPGSAWELAAFGVDTLNQRPDLFGKKDVRQAIANCMDRQKIVDTFLFGKSHVLNSYVPPEHPLYNDDIAKYTYDPEEAARLLDLAGWVDYDLDPKTPRTSVGVSGVEDGTSLQFSYMILPDAERPGAAEIIKEGLEECGIGVEITLQNWESLMMSGSDAPLFGRQFEMAQFAWSTSFDPACFLFLSSEIPGPYPEHPKGWGGANLTGFSNPDFDHYCQQTMSTLPGSQAYSDAHLQAQALFSDELPVIPLYQRIQVIAMRPDLCDTPVDAAIQIFSQLEHFDYGEHCQ